MRKNSCHLDDDAKEMASKESYGKEADSMLSSRYSQDIADTETINQTIRNQTNDRCRHFWSFISLVSDAKDVVWLYSILSKTETTIWCGVHLCTPSETTRTR